MRFKLKAEIIGFYRDDLHFDYDDGSFEWFDSTTLKIIEPIHLKDKEFYIFHNKGNTLDNIWTQIGKILAIEIDKNFIKSWEDIFNTYIFRESISYYE
jgi:hypothetical protein